MVTIKFVGDIFPLSLASDNRKSFALTKNPTEISHKYAKKGKKSWIAISSVFNIFICGKCPNERKNPSLSE